MDSVEEGRVMGCTVLEKIVMGCTVLEKVESFGGQCWRR